MRLTKRIASVNTAISKTSDPDKKSQKKSVVSKLEKERSKVQKVYQKMMKTLIERFNKFAAKNKVSAALAADERAKFGVAIANIEYPDLAKRAKEQNKLDKLNK